MEVKFDDTSKKLSCTVHRPTQHDTSVPVLYINGKKASYLEVDARMRLKPVSTYTIDPRRDWINGELSATCNYTTQYTTTPGLRTTRLLNPSKSYL